VSLTTRVKTPVDQNLVARQLEAARVLPPNSIKPALKQHQTLMSLASVFDDYARGLPIG